MTDGGKDWQSDWLTGLTHRLTDTLAHLINDWSWLQISDQLTVIRGQEVTRCSQSRSWRLAHTKDMWARAAFELVADKILGYADSHDSICLYDLINQVYRHQSVDSSLSSATNDWLAEWIINSLIHWLTDAKKEKKDNRLSCLLNDWLDYIPAGWLSDWESVWLTVSLSWWLTACYFFVVCLLVMAGGLVDWLSKRRRLAA